MGSLSVKASGVWQTVKNVKVKYNGAWTQVKQVYAKVSGVWKPVWSYIYTANVALPAYKGMTVNSTTYYNAVTGTQATLVYNDVNNTFDATDGMILYIYGATFVSGTDNATGFGVHDRTNTTSFIESKTYYDSSIAADASAIIDIGPHSLTATIIVNITSPTFTVKIKGNGLTSCTGTISYTARQA